MAITPIPGVPFLYHYSSGKNVFSNFRSKPAASVPTPPSTTGVEPQAFDALLYGKDIPLFVGGKVLLGGRIVEGPFFGGTQADPTVSFIAYHARSIVNELVSTTQITSARLRGQEVWNSTSGYLATDKLPTGSFAWNPGHATNIAFPQSVARYGSKAVAYAYGITSSWANIPLKPFGGIVPFPSVRVEAHAYGDPLDGISRTQAISNILTHMAVQDFEVDVSGSDPAWLVTNDMSLQDYLRQLREIFTRYQTSYSDKLRVIEPDTFEVAAELTNSNVMRDSLLFKRTDPMTLTSQKSYTYIDVDRDYEPNTVLAKEDRFPHPTTDATDSASIDLSIVTTAAQATADIHNSLYEELKVRSQMQGTVDRTLFGLECADVVRFADSDFIDMSARVMEAVYDFENWTVGITAGEVLNCGQSIDPDFGDVVLLLHFNDDFTDSSSFANPASGFGTPEVSAASKFGSGALLCTGDVSEGIVYNVATLGVAGTALSATNTSPYTIELWANFSAVNLVQFLIAIDTGALGRFFRLWQDGDDALKYRWDDTGGAYDPVNELVTSGLSIETGVWYHIAADKDSTGKVRLYVNGVMEASATPANSVIGMTGDPVSIGGRSVFNSPFEGYIDEVRITRMISRYGDVHGDSSFLPPTSPFPDE